MKRWIAERLRLLADRIDHAGAPKALHWTFTIEHLEGVRFREDVRGCRLWYYSDDQYRKAHAEADTEHMIVDWANGTARFGR